MGIKFYDVLGAWSACIYDANKGVRVFFTNPIVEKIIQMIISPDFTDRILRVSFYYRVIMRYELTWTFVSTDAVKNIKYHINRRHCDLFSVWISTFHRHDVNGIFFSMKIKFRLCRPCWTMGSPDSRSNEEMLMHLHVSLYCRSIDYRLSSHSTASNYNHSTEPDKYYELTNERLSHLRKTTNSLV